MTKWMAVFFGVLSSASSKSGGDSSLNLTEEGSLNKKNVRTVSSWGVWVFSFAFLLIPELVHGQATTGNIQGQVTDATGAGVTGAHVIVTNQETGAGRETDAGENGQFLVLRVAPGKYTVKVTKQGFRQYEVRDIGVAVALDTTVSAKLEIGGTSEVVVVEGGSAPLVEASTAQTTSEFDSAKIQDLPAVTGRLDTLALLSPGVIPGFGNVNANGTTLSVNGQRSRSNNFTIDGQDNNDNTLGGPGLFLSNIEVVDQFSIITNNFSAEYGRNQGAIVNLVTKSGTNNTHGTLFGYHQNDVFNANVFENDRDGIHKPHFNNNYDGGVLGGAIKKDKAFYFLNGSYDKQRSASVNTSTSNALVITPTGLNTLIAACGLTNTLAAYRDHGPFAQAIGSPQILPGSVTTANYVALAANDPCGGANFPFQVARISRVTPTPQTEWDGGGKFDFNLSPKNTLSVRYLLQDSVAQNQNGSSAGYEIDIPARSQNFGITFTRQLTSRQLNELRFNYGRLAVSFEGANTSPISQIGNNIARFSLPAGFLSFGLATNLPQNRKVNTYQWADNWSLIAGRNTFKAGADVRRQLTPTEFLPQVNGNFSFSRISPFIRNNPALDAPAAGAIDRRGILNGAAGNLLLPIKETDVFLYFQDDFKVKSNLTLNLGIRWEYTGQPLNIVHDITTQRESNPSTAFFDTAVPLDARTIPALNAPKKNFAPRLGFAYTPQWGKWLFGDNKTVIRGGYSIAYDPAFFNLLLNVSTATPTVFLYSLRGVTVPTDVTGNNLRTQFSPPLGTADPRLLNQTRFDTNFRSPYAENWTFGIQRQIGSIAFEVRYAGSRGVELYQSRDANPLVTPYIANGFANLLPPGVTPAPVSGRVTDNFRNLRIRGNTAASTYHGLQSEVRGTLWHQLNHGLSYTYSHNIDNVSEVFTFAGSGSVAFAQDPFNINKGERGNSNIDLRHVIAYNFDWQIPLKKEQQRFVGHALGGWEVSGIWRWSTGRPLTPICFACGDPLSDVSFNNTFIGTFDTAHPFVSNPNAPVGSTGIYTTASASSLHDFNNQTGPAITPSQVQFIIPNANAVSILGTPFGVGRNTIFGQHFLRGDFAVFKNNKISERAGVQFRWEVRNIFNTPFYNNGTPDITVDDGAPTFLNGPASAGLNVTTVARTMTFGLRFTF
jgi:Carboxypeptidase regulatory-like domain/TonB-dependent Receptor Plug Domain